jgi:hypothetical protein
MANAMTSVKCDNRGEQGSSNVAAGPKTDGATRTNTATRWYARSRQFAAGYAAKLPDGGIASITQPVLAISGDEDLSLTRSALRVSISL